MPVFYHHFINLVFIGIIALFPVVNPVGSAFIISPYLTGLNAADKRKAVGKIVLYAFLICIVSLFAGHWILALFGLSIPVIQLAGGIMICKMGWEFLSSDQKSPDDLGGAEAEKLKSGYDHIAGKLFYPITFPLTTGAGTISVLFTLSAHSESVSHSIRNLNILAILVSISVMCVLIYVFYLNTKTIIHFLGTNGETILNRISAFLIFCVGLQIALTGIKKLFSV
jgi:multiple antibiotic resistance protein